ncbi:MAG TPA: hypothetical protein VKU62_08910 [Thermoanaerobaculia bacterium]|nr:hypothetical protein [Thermoanaerobaculia bacterium]
MLRRLGCVMVRVSLMFGRHCSVMSRGFVVARLGEMRGFLLVTRRVVVVRGR